MRVILLQDVRNVGRKSEVKNVADGFAMNFLFPRKFAEVATDAVVRRLEEEKKTKTEEAVAKERVLGNMIDSLRNAEVNVSVRATDKGGLFKSVDSEVIAKAIRMQKSLEIPEEVIQIETPIKTTGKHVISLVHKTKKADLIVSVIPAL